MKKNELIKSESKDLFRDVFYNVDALLVLHDLDGYFIFTNRCFEEFFGYSKSEFQNKNLKDLIPDRYKLEFDDYLTRLKTNGYDNGILHVVAKDRRPISIEYKSNYFDSSEDRKCVSIICQDITEQLKTQTALEESDKKLKESERKYRDIFENINEGVYLHDLDGNFIDINTHFAKNIGYTKNEIKTKNARNLMPEKYKHEFDEYLKRIKINGYEKGVFQVTPKYGGTHLVEYINSLVQGEDGPVAVRGVARDVTEEFKARKALKQSQKELKESERKFRDIFDNINAYIYIHDLDGNYIETNAYFINNMGYSESELKTKNIKDLVLERHRLEVDDYLKRIKANGYENAFLKVVTKDGRIRVIEYTNSLIQGEDGPIAIRGLARDITEQFQAQKALEEIDKKLRESERKYRDIFENINEYIYLHDMDGYFIDTNSHFRNNIGYSKSEFQNITLKDMIPEKYKPGFDEYLKRIKANGYEKGLLRIVAKNGRELLVEYKNSLVQGLECPVFVRGVARNITDEYEARKALKISEEKLRIAHDELEKRVKERTKELKKVNEKLEEKTIGLEEANIALRVLLNRKDEAQKKAEEEMLSNIKELVMPLLTKIKLSRLSPPQITYLNLIESNLNNVMAPFAVKITSKFYQLTPAEIQIANLIREGKTTKEIAKLLNVAMSTIHTHRDSIRIKLGIKNKKWNLRAHLLNLEK